MNLRDVLKILKPYYKQMILIMLFAVIISIISAAVPFINSNMIDKGILKKSIPITVSYIFLLTGLQVVDQVIQYLQTYEEIKITNQLGKKLKVDAFTHGLKLKPHYFKEHGYYKTIGDALYDIGNIMNITNNNFLIIFVVICKSIGAAVGLIILDYRLAIFICLLIPIKLLINNIIRKKIEMLGTIQMTANKNYNTWFSDILFGITDIKLWNLINKKVREYSKHVDTINRSSQNLTMMNAGNNLLMRAIELIVLNSLYILGALLITKDQLTFGNLIAFISFSSYLLLPINIIIDLRIILKEIRPSVESIKQYYLLEEENYASALPLLSSPNSIEFKNVNIVFDGREVLKDISFTMKKGEKFAFVGANGSGKTTLLNLLLRMQEPTSGEIQIDGIPIQDYNIEDYRNKFSVVTQDIHLFQGTVRDNITFDSNTFEFTSNETIKFCTDVIEKWDKAYETEAGSSGMKLSGGERQKIALLRALNHKTSILILDEATSNYDTESENAFNEFIKHNTDYDFYFIITHRKEILNNVDKVLYLSNGHIEINNIYK